MLDHGLDPQEAADLPRTFFGVRGLCLETDVPDGIAAELASMGHAITRALEPFGGSQIIVYDNTSGTLKGASDPRKDGFAAGL
jgi:gamma-glutamyltranspeptidase/glutathione hydrolase